MILSHSNQMECPELAFTVLKEIESPFSGWRCHGRSGWSRGALSLKLVHFMPDVVRYVWYELLTTFLGAVATPLLISDSEFGSEQIFPAAPVPALHPCIRYICILTWETFQIKNNYSRSNGVSLFALEYTWHCSLAFRRRNASEKCRVYSNGKNEARFEREWCFVSPFFRWRKPFVNW